MTHRFRYAPEFVFQTPHGTEDIFVTYGAQDCVPRIGESVRLPTNANAYYRVVGVRHDYIGEVPRVYIEVV